MELYILVEIIIIIMLVISLYKNSKKKKRVEPKIITLAIPLVDRKENGL